MPEELKIPMCRCDHNQPWVMGPNHHEDCPMFAGRRPQAKTHYEIDEDGVVKQNVPDHMFENRHVEASDLRGFDYTVFLDNALTQLQADLVAKLAERNLMVDPSSKPVITMSEDRMTFTLEVDAIQIPGNWGTPPYSVGGTDV